MPVAQLGAHFKAARKALKWSQRQVADGLGVSERLVREFERGERTNISVETAFRLLAYVGVSLLIEPHTAYPVRIRVVDLDDHGIAARAKIRRETWGGKQTYLSAQDDEPPPPRGAGARMAAVAQASLLAHGLAASVVREKRARESDT